MYSHFSEKCGNFFQLWRQVPLHWRMWYLFSVMETDYSTPLITVCSENSIPKTVFPIQWRMWYFFQLWRQVPLQWRTWYFFQLMETCYSALFFSVCSETLIQQNFLPTSVNNVVIFLSCGYRYRFTEQCGNFFQLWRQSTQPLYLLYALKPQSNKNVFPLQWTMWYFFQLWIQIPLQWTTRYFF